jgi:hypothetical protein
MSSLTSQVDIFVYDCLHTKIGKRLIAVALAATTAGCIHTLPEAITGTTGHIEIMHRAAEADDAQLEQIKREALQRYQSNATDLNQLRLALVLSAPSADIADLELGLGMLSELSTMTTSLGTTATMLASARLEEVESRLALHRSHGEKEREIQQLMQHLAEARAKIEELLNIERSMEDDRRRSSPAEY